MNVMNTYDLVTNLLDKHGISHWLFGIGRGKNLMGSCNHKDKKITLSRYLIRHGTDEEIRDTILHEIAHALAGPAAKHGFVWKAKCREIGAKPSRLAHKVSYTVPHKVELHCNTHGCIDKRHRRLKQGRLERIWCNKCGRSGKGQLVQMIVA